MNEYLAILFLLIFAIIFSGVLLVLARFIGPYRPSSEKMTTYECGMEPYGDARGRFNIKFFLIALAFAIFDVGKGSESAIEM